MSANAAAEYYAHAPHSHHHDMGGFAQMHHNAPSQQAASYDRGEHTYAERKDDQVDTTVSIDLPPDVADFAGVASEPTSSRYSSLFVAVATLWRCFDVQIVSCMRS